MRFGIRARLLLVSFALIALAAASTELFLRRRVDPRLEAQARATVAAEARLAAAEARAAPAAPTRAAWDRLAASLAPAGGWLGFFDGAGALLGQSAPPEFELAAALRESNLGVPALREGLARQPLSTPGQLWERVRVSFVRGGERSGEHGGEAAFVDLVAPLDEAQAAQGALRSALVLASLLAIAGALVVTGLSARWMSQLVARLAGRARRMASGDPGARTAMAGPHEFGELGRVVDQLAESLLSALRDLRAESEMLRSVLETMQEGVLVLDTEGRIEHLNPALREMLLLGSDLRGRSPLEALRNAELQDLLKCVRERGEPAAAEIDVAGLKPRRLLVRASPLPAAPGGLVAAFVDLTRLRQLETLRRDFVANVSHELRTPVASIRSAAETLAGPARDNPQAAARFIEMIERNAARMQRLVDDLLDLARIEAREFHVEIGAVDLARAVEQVLALTRDRAERKNLALENRVEPGVAVLADRRALDQILTNLVDNAIKYCGEGTSVEVRARRDDGRVRIEVADTGPGIEPRHLSRLFERFYRVDPGRSRELGGTGLGLSIVKHLSEAMGGTVGVESTPGQGSIFSVTVAAAVEPSRLPGSAGLP